MGVRDLYQVLGVDKYASKDQLKEAYDTKYAEVCFPSCAALAISTWQIPASLVATCLLCIPQLLWTISAAFWV